MYFGIFLLILAGANGQNCFKETEEICNSLKDKSKTLTNCNAKYGNFDSTLVQLQAYAIANLKSSYNYLLLSTHFANYQTNRDGFKLLYRKMSDELWDDAVDLMKFITKRGGEMNFNQPSHLDNSSPEGRLPTQFAIDEMPSLSRALDEQKKLANKAHEIYNVIHKHTKPDASLIHFIEKKFLEPHADRIRTLAGHSSDLQKMMIEPHAPLALFMFDEYLQKI